MQELRIFLSVGKTATNAQEKFIRAVEDRLRSEGLVPYTVGRNTFSSDTPLKTVTDLLSKCCGMVVIALERTHFPSGTEKRGGPEEVQLSDIRLPTPWNQIEAAMAYTLGYPLLVIVEDGLRREGLLERGNDWHVQWIKPEPECLTTPEFNGVLSSWKSKLMQAASAGQKSGAGLLRKPASDMSVGELISSLKPAQFWSVLVALAAVIAGAFALGANLFHG